MSSYEISLTETGTCMVVRLGLLGRSRPLWFLSRERMEVFLKRSVSPHRLIVALDTFEREGRVVVDADLE
jgi:hypothetical protein